MMSQLLFPARFAISPQELMGVLVIAVAGGALLLWGVISLVITPSRTGGRHCPHCGSARVRGSWLRVLDRYLIWLKPFRCEACSRRFYMPKRFA